LGPCLAREGNYFIAGTSYWAGSDRALIGFFWPSVIHNVLPAAKNAKRSSLQGGPDRCRSQLREYVS
jgi:hypothetical protein